MAFNKSYKLVEKCISPHSCIFMSLTCLSGMLEEKHIDIPILLGQFRIIIVYFNRVEIRPKSILELKFLLMLRISLWTINALFFDQQASENSRSSTHGKVNKPTKSSASPCHGPVLSTQHICYILQ